jgi:hypothetical protein
MRAVIVSLALLSQPTPIYPPAWVFALPPSVLGTAQQYHGQTIWRPRGMDSSSVAAYHWFITPTAIDAQTRDYLHHQSVRSGCVGYGPCWSGRPRPTISVTVWGPRIWVLGRYDSVGYAYSAGAVFRNLSFTVDAWCHIPRAAGRDACQAWTISTLERLLGRVRDDARAQT